MSLGDAYDDSICPNHWHFVIMSDQFNLFCWVLDISHNIARSKTVGDLAHARY